MSSTLSLSLSPSYVTTSTTMYIYHTCIVKVIGKNCIVIFLKLHSRCITLSCKITKEWPKKWRKQVEAQQRDSIPQVSIKLVKLPVHLNHNDGSNRQLLSRKTLSNGKDDDYDDGLFLKLYKNIKIIIINK